MPENAAVRYLAKTWGWLCGFLHTKSNLKTLQGAFQQPFLSRGNVDLTAKELVPFNDLIAIPEQYFRRLILERDSLALMLSAIAADASVFKTVSGIYSIYRINDALCDLTEGQKILAELIFEFMPDLEGKESFLLDILSQTEIVNLSLSYTLHEGDSLLIGLIHAVKNPQFSCLSIFSVSGNQQVFNFLADCVLRHFGEIQFASFVNHLNIEDPTDLLSQNDIYERVVSFVSNLSETRKESLIPHFNGTLRRRLIEEDLFL